MKIEKDHDITNKHKRYVFLDDFREPHDAFFYKGLPIYNEDYWVVVRSYDEFVRDILENGLADGYFFDHDLADVHYEKPSFNYDDENLEKTGYHCAKWLIYYCIDNKKELPAVILVHSLNTTGSQNIWSLFNSYWKSLE
jgi:hypothetical protein